MCLYMYIQLCAYIHVCIYTCMCACVCAHVCTGMCILYMCMCVSVYMHVYMTLCVHTCVHTHVRVCVCVCVCTHTHVLVETLWDSKNHVLGGGSCWGEAPEVSGIRCLSGDHPQKQSISPIVTKRRGSRQRGQRRKGVGRPLGRRQCADVPPKCFRASVQ